MAFIITYITVNLPWINRKELSVFKTLKNKDYRLDDSCTVEMLLENEKRINKDISKKLFNNKLDEDEQER